MQFNKFGRLRLLLNTIGTRVHISPRTDAILSRHRFCKFLRSTASSFNFAAINFLGMFKFLLNRARFKKHALSNSRFTESSLRAAADSNPMLYFESSTATQKFGYVWYKQFLGFSRFFYSRVSPIKPRKFSRFRKKLNSRIRRTQIYAQHRVAKKLFFRMRPSRLFQQ